MFQWITFIFRNPSDGFVKDQCYLSRSEIEKEVENMIANIVALKDNDDDGVLYVADTYCHLDILYEK